MIYRLFQINKPIVLTLLPIICLSLWFPSIISDGQKIFFEKYSLLQFYDSLTISLSQFLAILIILITAVLISFTINGSELFTKNQYLPSILYVLIMSSINEHHVLNPIVIANLFIVLSIYFVFQIYRQVPCKNLIFKSTCLILIASIFYYPYLLLFPLPWIVLSIIRPFETREWLMPIVSLFLVVFYLLLFEKISSKTFNFQNFTNFFNRDLMSFKFTYILKIIIGLLSFGLCYSLLKLFKLNAKSTNRFRKLSLILFFVFVLFLTIATINYFYYLNMSIIILLLAIPVSYILPFSLVHLKKKWLSEIYLSSVFFLIFYHLIFL